MNRVMVGAVDEYLKGFWKGKEGKKRKERKGRKEKKEKIKEAMKKPIQGLPVQKVSKYEQIRLDIIKEREQAMAESGFLMIC